VAFLRQHRDEVAEVLRVRQEGDGERPARVHGTDRNGEVRDYYGRRAHAALDAICAIQVPDGLIVWLDEHSASLYERLTCELPDEISRAWNARIPPEAFDALCSRMVDTFRFAAELYRDSKQTPNLLEQRKTSEGCV
jgi:hypothetical protein